MGLEGKDNGKRVTAYLSLDEYDRFKSSASMKYMWESGFTRKTVHFALLWWMECYDYRLAEILMKKYPDIKSEKELIKKAAEELLKNYYEMNKKYLD